MKVTDDVRVVDEVPEGYMTLLEFCEGVGSKVRSLQDSIGYGKIDKKHLVKIPFGQNGRYQVFINWDACAYNYIIGRREEFWPADFKPNDEKKYYPEVLVFNGEKVVMKGEDSEHSEVLAKDLTYKKVTDISSAKFRMEQLKIAREQERLRREMNQSVDVKDVEAQQREIGLALKTKASTLFQDTANRLAVCSSPRECKFILEEVYREILGALFDEDNTDQE